MKKEKTIRSFTLYFTDKKEMEKAIAIADSDEWRIDYEIVNDYLDEDDECLRYAVVEFWWDDITIATLSEFLSQLTQ